MRLPSRKPRGLTRFGGGLPALALALPLVAALLAGGLAGCGEKIAIPEAEGLFSTSGYEHKSDYSVEGVQQLIVANNLLFVLTESSLTKRDINFNEIDAVQGLNGATALCVYPDGSLIFVWEQGIHRISWYSQDDLQFIDDLALPELNTPVAMVTSDAGVDQLGVDTYLYISDPAAEVIHRYAFSTLQGLFPYGILARSDGDGTRYVHVPAGMCSDSEGMLLVCDTDPARNWVIRFDSTPDLTDTTDDPYDEDPLRGEAVLFSTQVCEPAAPDEYVLGDAAECKEEEWVGGPSTERGEFHSPHGVTIDEIGRIFVADTENDRVQVFPATGGDKPSLVFGSVEESPKPKSIGVVNISVGEEESFPAAFVFLAHPEGNLISSWIQRKFKESDTGEYYD